MASSALTLAEVATKITDVRASIASAEVALSYGKGDKQATRQTLASLQRQLNGYLRHERELTAAANGANSPGVVTASWS